MANQSASFFAQSNLFLLKLLCPFIVLLHYDVVLIFFRMRLVYTIETHVLLYATVMSINYIQTFLNAGLFILYFLE